MFDWGSYNRGRHIEFVTFFIRCCEKYFLAEARIAPTFACGPFGRGLLNILFDQYGHASLNETPPGDASRRCPSEESTLSDSEGNRRRP